MLYLMKSKSYHLLVEGYGEMSWIEKKRDETDVQLKKSKKIMRRIAGSDRRDRLRQHC